jgi:hypothetical protein
LKLGKQNGRYPSDGKHSQDDSNIPPPEVVLGRTVMYEYNFDGAVSASNRFNAPKDYLVCDVAMQIEYKA